MIRESAKQDAMFKKDIWPIYTQSNQRNCARGLAASFWPVEAASACRSCRLSKANKSSENDGQTKQRELADAVTMQQPHGSTGQCRALPHMGRSTYVLPPVTHTAQHKLGDRIEGDRLSFSCEIPFPHTFKKRNRQVLIPNWTGGKLMQVG